MSIAINSNFERNQLVASSAGQTVFTYNFPIFDERYLSVFKYAAGVTPDDSTQILALGIDYSVTGVGEETGGTIILNVGAAIGDIITIMGTEPIDRINQFQDLNPFTVAMNQQLNELTVMLQQVYTYWNNFTPRYNADQLVSDQVRPFKRILPMLPNGHVWVGRGEITEDPDDIVTELFSSPGGGTTGEITQDTSGIVLQDIVRINSAGLYVPALGDGATNAEVIGMVTKIIDANHMIVQQSGRIDPSLGLNFSTIIGDPQFLSTTNPGKMTSIDPATSPNVSRPIFVADKANAGWILPYRGKIFGGGAGGAGCCPVGGLGLDWETVSGGTIIMNPFTGYIVTGGSLTTLVLPPNFNVGDPILIYDYSSGRYEVDVGTGQTVQFANTATTTTTGTITSTSIGDCMMLIGLVKDVAMGVFGPTGWQLTV